jgi:hypothetical protein
MAPNANEAIQQLELLLQPEETIDMVRASAWNLSSSLTGYFDSNI